MFRETQRTCEAEQWESVNAALVKPSSDEVFDKVPGNVVFVLVVFLNPCFHSHVAGGGVDPGAVEYSVDCYTNVSTS